MADKANTAATAATPIDSDVTVEVETPGFFWSTWTWMRDTVNECAESFSDGYTDNVSNDDSVRIAGVLGIVGVAIAGIPGAVIALGLTEALARIEATRGVDGMDEGVFTRLTDTVTGWFDVDVTPEDQAA